MSQIRFIHLERPNKDQQICVQTKLLYERGSRALILVEDQDHATHLQELLWTFQRESFIPHVCLPCDPKTQEQTPIWISVEPVEPAHIDTLILGRACDFAYMHRFLQIVDFAEIHDPDKRTASRARFRYWQDAGFAPEYIKNNHP